MENETSLADDISAAMSGSGTASSQSTETSATTADTTASTGAATTQPADAAAATTSAVQTTNEGPIPFTVHKTALENARTKATQDAQERFSREYGWATEVSPQEFQTIRSIASRFASGDTIGGLTDLVAEARKDPAIDAQLRSFHARQLAAARGQTAGPDLNPIQVQLENGNTVGLYSADQIAALKDQWLAQVKQEFQPVTHTIETLQAERAQAVQQQRVDHFVSTTYADVQTWPGMGTKEAQAMVAQELRQARIDHNDPREVALALDRAYRKCILPTLSTASRHAALNDVTFKAQTNTVSPSHQSTGSPKAAKDMSWTELFRSEMAAGRK